MADINRGPLTTTFTPPNPCDTQATRIYQVSESDQIIFAQGPVDLGSCWPNGYSSQATEYYSPGLCPSDFTPACNRTSMIGASTETIQTCCPTKYNYTCQSPGYTGWGGCFWELPEVGWQLQSVYVVENGTTTVASNIISTGGDINALSVQVRFQSSDFSSMKPKETSSPTVPSTTSSAADTSDSGRGGLSTGARAGIGVGVAVGALIISALAVFMFLRKRGQRKRTEQRNPPAELHSEYKSPDERNDGVAELPADEPTDRVAELPTEPSHFEMESPEPSGHGHHEISQTAPVELEGDTIRHTD
ncbi:hypothetical protein F5B20DRAFT_543082 [Whalleya microplaca]|nr:hypothetical protein F5B20DRAFT_543082 [Whalleya microplaca]